MRAGGAKGVDTDSARKINKKFREKQILPNFAPGVNKYCVTRRMRKPNLTDIAKATPFRDVAQ